MSLQQSEIVKQEGYLPDRSNRQTNVNLRGEVTVLDDTMLASSPVKLLVFDYSTNKQLYDVLVRAHPLKNVIMECNTVDCVIDTFDGQMLIIDCVGYTQQKLLISQEHIADRQAIIRLY
jgi:hypothetical protein